ncbi:GNAT family N-acetyltransferase [Halobacterium salinarum]|uniref:Acetyltransferase n=3 Tax=Halobacterium salinarum TaxID=2242 RepID=Q9HMZ2_HALSA|nr:GNAT family protein [Halobacterium salinarum]AAG20429.1 putative acetyltransferase [Halobacterium salinarum NRC-1]MBB6089642.1 RimJ/RimL family protein N-acetyltransferase [Halobacterium salinarum]MCF2207197.1 GNAT family N-acetyltransferase [Halobacterium salinarum]MCF2241223.1 GNAT family N-acetyltransferase [Halobacterium salinarum]MDL0119821.1 GNAT family protein [Halobacterium salinarum]
MPGPAFADGDAVSLHPIEDEDHEFIQYGRNQPDVRVPLTDTDIRTLDDVAESVEDSDDRFLICVDDRGDSTDEPASSDADNPTPVGEVAFAWVSQAGEHGSLMYWIAPDHQGNGYVTEATTLFLDYVFGERGFHRVDAHVLAPNEASQAALEKLGFEREGQRRDDAIVDGEYVDTYTYGLLDHEWLDD